MEAFAVWVREAFSGRLSVYQAAPGAVVRELLPVGHPPGPVSDFYVKCNGRRVCPEEQLQSGLVYSVEPRLCGGKGGFGSMLRALGAQIEKTTNREACRDLSGRRLRDVNHEKDMVEWIKKQAEREAEKEQQRLERLKRKHFFIDPKYPQQCSDMSYRLEDYVIKGLQASSSSAVSADSSDIRKRKKVDSGKKSGKKRCFWTGLEGLEVSFSSDSGSESDSESPSTSASCSSTSQRLQNSDSDSDGPAQHSYVNVTSEQRPESSRAASSMAEDVEQPESNPEEQPQSFSDITEHREAGHSTQNPTDYPDEEAQCFSSITTSMSSAEHREIESMQESIDVEQQNTIPEPEKHPHATTDTQKEASNVDQDLLDLLPFTSASELESLGLEKLKTKLMTFGLKCNGTLPELAARLFLMRIHATPQMDSSPKQAKEKRNETAKIILYHARDSDYTPRVRRALYLR